MSNIYEYAQHQVRYDLGHLAHVTWNLDDIEYNYTEIMLTEVPKIPIEFLNKASEKGWEFVQCINKEYLFKKYYINSDFENLKNLFNNDIDNNKKYIIKEMEYSKEKVIEKKRELPYNNTFYEQFIFDEYGTFRTWNTSYHSILKNNI